jgi:hypothetical protein
MLLGLISFKKNKKDQNVTPTTQHILTTYSLPQSIYSIIYRLSPEILTSIEFQKYKKMVANGTIYDDFAKDFKFKGELPKGKTKRDVVKKLFMHCFYSENGAFSGGLKTLFDAKFPKIYKLICEIKKNDHTALAIALQRIESTLVLDKICGRIAKENPSIPLLTIHDSILTTPENVDYVVKILKSVLQEYIGIAPELSIEPCHPKANKMQLVRMNRIAKHLLKNKENEEAK